MLIITKLKQLKKYVEKELPNFETQNAKIMYLNAQKNNSINLSLINIPIISENEEPVYTNAFTKAKKLRDGYLVKSRSIYGRKNN